MKQILKVFYSLLLVLTLAACGSKEDNRQSPNALSAANNEQTSLSSVESNEPIEQNHTEDRNPASLRPIESSEQTEKASVKNDVADRLIQITTEEGREIVFQLNKSPAASSFYYQLPLSIWVEDYAGSEKTFYLPEALDTSNTPLAQGPAGTLAYYAPWGNVAIFYGECGEYSGLYELGEAVSGVEFISAMTGEVRMEAVDVSSASAEFAQTESAPPHQTQPLPPSAPENLTTQDSTSERRSEENTTMKLNLQIGNSTFTATLEENAAVDSFVSLMKTAPLVIQMSDYAGFEKVGSLGTNLPTSNGQTTTQSGDIVLYNGNQIVIFYGSNSWSYTRLGTIDDLTGWEKALGNGDVTVTFSVG